MKLELVTEIGILAFGIATLVQSFHIRILKFGGSMGGDVFPKALSIALIVLSAIVFIIDLGKYLQNKNLKKTRAFATEGASVVKSAKERGYLNVLFFTVLFAIDIFSIRYIGFVMAMIPLIFANYLLQKKEIRKTDWLIALAYALGVTVVFWALFEKVFEVILPQGIWF
jgi:hypothetical protein